MGQYLNTRNLQLSYEFIEKPLIIMSPAICLAYSKTMSFDTKAAKLVVIPPRVALLLSQFLVLALYSTQTASYRLSVW